MVKEIITDEEQLSARSDEVDTRKESKYVQAIVLALKDTCVKNNLTGLSAIQIGIQKRILVVNFKGNVKAFVNPIVTNCEGFTLARETCISIPDKTFIVPRYNKVDVTYQTVLGKVESREFLGVAAHVFQHQLDHLDGLLVSDFALEVDADEYDNATEDERTELIKQYLESIDVKYTDLQKEIQEDPELKQLSDGIKFMEMVQKGEVELGDPVSVTKDVQKDE